MELAGRGEAHADDEGDEEKEGDDDDDDDDGSDVEQVRRKKRESPFAPVLRSKGFMWLATRNKLMGEWSQSGLLLTIKSQGASSERCMQGGRK